MKKISNKIIINNIMIAFLILVLIGVVSFNWASGQIKKHSDEIFQKDVLYYSARINDVFKQTEMIANSIESVFDDLYRAIGYDDTKSDEVVLKQDAWKAMEYLNSKFLKESKGVKRSSIVFRGNYLQPNYKIWVSGKSDDLTKINTTYKSGELAKEYLEQYGDDIYTDNLGKKWLNLTLAGELDEVTYYEPILQDGILVGFLLLDLDTDYLKGIINSIQIYETGYGMLIDEYYNYIVHRELSGKNLKEINNGQYRELADEMVLKKQGAKEVEYKGIVKQFAFLELENEWYLGMVVPKNEIYAPIWRLILEYIMSMALIVLIVIFAAYKSGMAITKPINEMQLGIKELENGNYMTRLPTHLIAYQNEIGVLANAVNKMVDQISLEILKSRGQTEKLKREMVERERIEAELFLNSQILAKAKEGMFITDDKFRVVYINDAFVNITGFSEERVLGKRLKFSNIPYEHDDERDMYDVLLSRGNWKGEIRQRRKNGETYLQKISLARIEEDDGTKYIGIFEDATALERAEKNIDYLRNHDSITELPRKNIFVESLNQMIIKNAPQKQLFNVVIVGLDNFRIINEAIGHSSGDQVLRHIAEQLKALPNYTILSRISGDEFAMIVESKSYVSFVKWIKHLQDKIKEPLRLAGTTVTMTCSMGISTYPLDGNSKESLLRKAQIAMNYVKENGKNGYKFYSDEIESNSSDRLELATYLRMALDKNEFVLYYQPIVDLNTEKIVSAEALIRWEHPKEGLVSPNKFIPLAEEMGIIKDIGTWVLLQACRDGKILNTIRPNLSVAVNVAANQFEEDILLKNVKDACSKYEFDLNNLELEITERMLVKDHVHAENILRELKELGVRVAIDDFGTGYSSLNYLKSFAVDKLKVDKSFVDPIEVGNEDLIAPVIIQLAKGLKLSAVAEGIETKKQAEYLRRQNCEYGQGYYYSKPIPFDEFMKLLKENENS
jgi:diguanylate cyclase (GGDEF)-like protein/PAS domain S-box-containing protein